MIVQELIELLSQMNPDAEVRLAQQPRWPFEHVAVSVVEVDLGAPDPEEVSLAEEVLGNPESSDEEREAARNQMAHDDSKLTVVYIVEGSQIGYLPGSACKAIGW